MIDMIDQRAIEIGDNTGENVRTIVMMVKIEIGIGIGIEGEDDKIHTTRKTMRGNDEGTDDVDDANVESGRGRKTGSGNITTMTTRPPTHSTILLYTMRSPALTKREIVIEIHLEEEIPLNELSTSSKKKMGISPLPQTIDN
jgi:hypothetical protein